MTRQVLIIHGWSDTSKSFRPLCEFLRSHEYDPHELWLGDYISMDDDVRVSDVGRRMAEVIDERLASKELESSFDVIVHSTGGLVAREWLTTRYRDEPEKCPMKRLIMLAPANHGSKLAASGKSFLGRVVKGYNNWFQTGSGMLDDLELSSPYQWELAQRDVLAAPGSAGSSYYGDDRIWPFVIVGTHPYANLLRQIVNENGSDGTVRVCAANLRASGVTVDFSGRDAEVSVQVWKTRVLGEDIPLAVLPTRTHGSIIDPTRADPGNRESIDETDDQMAVLGNLLLEALACKSAGEYRDIAERWNEISEATASRRKGPGRDSPEIFHQYMQANVLVVDDTGQVVPDYFLEFYSGTAKRNDEANVYLHGKVIEDVKINSRNKALRNLYFDRTDLMDGYYPMVKGEKPATLYMSISAAAPGQNVSYFSREKEGAAGEFPVHFEADPSQRWFRRNTTHYVKIVIPRRPATQVFKLNRFA